MAGRFFTNRHFREYRYLLLRLHRLIRAGKDETAEGEALREQMDKECKHLDQEEIDYLNKLSAIFYTISSSFEPKG